LSANALSNKQFSVERNLMAQGNMDELTNRVRGYQNMTSNKFLPAFGSDYTQVRSMPSGTAFAGTSVAGPGGEDEED